MGKRISDLRLDDNPIEQQQDLFDHRAARQDDAASVADLRDQPWFQFVGEIDELLESDEYLFAVDTLTGIKETVESTRRVTEGQRRAIDNISARGESHKYHRPFRRWLR